MFYVAFFWAYFNFALFPEHVSNAAVAEWPPAGVHTFDPFHLPFLNTMILLLSGCTITWAHHSLLERDRRGLLTGLALTVVLGLCFTMCQAIEYSHAPFKLVGGGIYPATFFLATGFHGFHVIVGTCFLIVCFFRAQAGQFTPERHFGFEAAAWYWHFVDVVWLFLFICIYVSGAGVTE
jgi:cytochrome c oxidase subunit 3